eukprot:COSAG06_NODE_54952_length_292_cov_0.673575_1_plen_59_part_01
MCSSRLHSCSDGASGSGSVATERSAKIGILNYERRTTASLLRRAVLSRLGQALAECHLR